jgi:hypothetical protein
MGKGSVNGMYERREVEFKEIPDEKAELCQIALRQRS